MAAEILTRIRANEQYADKEIVFAIFIQSGDTDIVPGNFVAEAVVPPGEIQSNHLAILKLRISSCHQMKRRKYLRKRTANIKNFNRDLSSYFDSLQLLSAEGNSTAALLNH